MRSFIARYLFGRKAAPVCEVSEALAFTCTEDTPLTERIMSAYNMRGLAGYTADEVADVIGVGVLTVRPRVTELFQSGKLRKTTTKRLNRSGVKAVVLVTNRIPAAISRRAA